MAPSLLPSEQNIKMNTVKIPLLSREKYRDAVAKCRLQHKFYFLSLPTAVRGLIYIRLWENSTIKVTSWLKQHEGEFVPEEHCQLLLTCKTIHSEARVCYYRLITWKVASMSRLQHFTWPTTYPHCPLVVKLTLTDLDSLPEFSRHAHQFSKLRILTVDAAPEFRIKTSRRVQNNNERQAFVNSLLSRRYYKGYLAPYFYTLRTYIVHMTITITYDNGITEVECRLP